MNTLNRITTIMMVIALLLTIRVNAQNYVQGEILVKIDKEITAQQFAQQIVSVALTPKKKLSDRMNIWLFEFPVNLPMDSVIATLKKNRNTISVQPNHYVQQRATPNDPGFSNQWGMNKIKAPDAWNITTGGTSKLGDNIIIAIVDGGFDLNHTDINYWKNTNEIPGNGIDDDGNGYIDDYDGWNAYNSNGNITSDSHGTHVAGIAGAKGNNGDGVTGVNWNIKTMPIMGSSGTESVVIEALGYALEMRTLYNQTNGAKGAFVVVTNGSFGVDKADPSNYPLWCSIYDDLGQVGILSVAATANGSWDVDDKGDMPTRCSSNYLIGVTNTDSNDDLNSGAAWGKNSIDLAAPGTGIYSTLPGNTYGNLSGTSMAAPHVAGAVALMYAAACEKMMQDYKTNPSAVALSIKQFLLNNSDPVWSLLLKIGYGRLNVYRSIIKMSEQYDYDLYVTGTETASKQYDAIHDITVENYETDGNYAVTFRSGNSITFKPGTHLVPGPGKPIHAFIDKDAFSCAIPFEPLTVDLLAPENAYCGGGHVPITCNAVPTGGKLPYSYVWYSKIITSSTWITHNVNSPNIAFGSSEDFYVQAKVTDDRGVSALSPIKFVNCIDAKMAPPSDTTRTHTDTIIDLTSQTSVLTSISQNNQTENLRQSFKVYPNPSSGKVNVSFTISKASSITVQILDNTGKKVADVVTNKPYEIGEHIIEFDGGNLPVGLYFYTIITDEGINALKLIRSK